MAVDGIGSGGIGSGSDSAGALAQEWRQEEERKSLVQGQGAAEMVADAAALKEASQELSEDAENSLEVGRTQEQRGEDWQSFAQTDDDTQLPPSVEVQAQQGGAGSQSDGSFNLGQMINQMAIRDGKINA